MTDKKNDDFDIDFGDMLVPDKPAPKSRLDTILEEVEKKKPNPVLLVIRHGNTFEEGETPRRIGARTDLQLTQEGRRQLARLRQFFEQEGIVPERVYSSPLQRTLQSAALLTTSYEILEFLREIYHGLDENKTDEEVIRRIGAKALHDWETKSILPMGWTADILGIRQGWNGLKKLSRDNGGVWAAVTSGGIARFALDGVENAPEVRKLSTGAYGKLVYHADRGVWFCEGWNLKP